MRFIFIGVGTSGLTLRRSVTPFAQIMSNKTGLRPANSNLSVKLILHSALIFHLIYHYLHNP